MPKFDAVYSTPTRTRTPVADSARAAFQNEEAEKLFTGLGLREGGFKANANRVFMLDDKGKLVTPSPYDPEKDNDMTAAAQDGRLYIMDKNYRLRQVRLEGNKDDGFVFAATQALRRGQMPGNYNSLAYRLNYLKVIVSDMSQSWNDMKKDIMSSKPYWISSVRQIRNITLKISSRRC